MKLIGSNEELRSIIKLSDSHLFLLVPFTNNFRYHYSGNHINSAYIHDLSSDERYFVSFDRLDIKNCNIKEFKFLNANNCVALESRILYNFCKVRDLSLYTWFYYNQYLELKSDIISFYNKNCPQEVNQCSLIPYQKLYEIGEKVSNAWSDSISEESLKEPSFVAYSDMLVSLCSIETNGILCLRAQNSDGMCSIRGGHEVFGHYTLRAITGRPSNTAGGFNFLSMNKFSGVRKFFIARPEKIFVEIDFSAFHPRLLSELAGYDFGGDYPYSHLGKYYENFNIEEKDYKVTTLRQLYGSIDEKFLSIPFFQKILDYRREIYKKYLEDGYIETPIAKRRIDRKYFESESEPLALNYMAQAFEFEKSMDVLNRLSKQVELSRFKPVLYVYDSILFEVDTEYYKEFIFRVVDFSKNENLHFKVKTGYNYQDLEEYCNF